MVNTFFESLKSGDSEKAIKCFTPTIQKQFQLAVDIAGLIFGNNLDSIVDGIIGISTSSSYSNYDFIISGTDEIDESHATVYVDVYINGQISERTTVECIRYDGEWYIAK